SRLPIAVATAMLAFFAVLAVGAAVAGQDSGVGIFPPRSTPTPLPTATPLPTPTPTPIPTVVVPNLINDPQARARERLRANNLDAEVVEEFNRDVAAGLVFAQDPAPPATLEQGQRVKLTVSKGAQRGPVPGVITKTNQAAVEELVGAGFIAKTVEEFNDQFAAGLVFAQEPAPDRPADLGSEVIIRVSRGKEQIAVPTVRGKSEAEARQVLQDAGFAVSSSYEAFSGVAAEQVFAVEPPEGSRVDKGFPVRIRVRRDPTPTPVPPTATPTATNTPRPTQVPERTPTGAPSPGRTPSPPAGATARPSASPTPRS
ncbi:MAG: PASTA domain-containing protein, partial [Chloroflexota bacterium]|nr:PASTA domain-containing protein [Chloroflexota bacterium]